MTVTIAWVLAALLAATASPAPGSGNNPFAQEILDAHNRYRAMVGVPPLIWSDDLARSANAWAKHLDANLAFEHDRQNDDQGENLWMGTSGAFSLTQMVDGWGGEKRYFHDGVFPDVSTTGNWFDVGHYSQMIWKHTRRVGCAGIDGSDGLYRLVCRYSPPGNVVGRRAF